MTNFEPCAAEVMRRFAVAAGGSWIEVGGGVAGYTGDDSPVNAAKGLALGTGESELRQVTEFFFDHRKDATVELAPWVEEACREDLARQGYEWLASENVMVRRCELMAEPLEIVGDLEDWGTVLSYAFFGELNDFGRRILGIMSRTVEAIPVGISMDGQLAAAAQLMVIGKVGLLGGDGTLEQYRGRGLQQRLIRGRVGMAAGRGLEWVHAEVVDGSGSHRNYERCGFHKLYERIHYIKRFAEN